MIIKFIPETEAEKAKHKEVEYTEVKEFFVFGNRKDADGYLVDFHEWAGGYRYLLGSLNFFYNEINDERRDGSSNRIVMQASQKPDSKGFVKHGDSSPIEIIDQEENVVEEQDDKAEENVLPENPNTITFPNASKTTKFNAKDIETFIKNANEKYGKK